MSRVSKKIKILYINPGLNYCGGVESYSMNYFRKIDKKKFQIDFATHDLDKLNYKDEIEQSGGKVFVFPPFKIKNYFKNLKIIKEFFRTHPDYDIVHCNMPNASPFYFYYAKKNGIPIRILHNHQVEYAAKLSHSLRNIPLIYFGKKLATHFFACSHLAGKFLFKDQPYYLVSNAVDIKKFQYNEKTREKIRKKENYRKEDIVLAHIGRFSKEKNQLFLLDMIKELQKENKNYRLLLIGSGEYERALKEKIRENHLEKVVKMKKPINNVHEYLQAIDLLLLPSLFEGLPVIGVEAQAAGVPFVLSDVVTKEVKINDNVYFLSLKEDASFWAKQIINIPLKRDPKNKKFSQSDFNIDNSVTKLEELYIKLVNKE